MRVGVIGFGRTGKSVANVILENPTIRLEWVVRDTRRLEHRSVPEFFGVESCEPGVIYSRHEFSAEQLLDRSPVDVIIDFSSPNGIYYYGASAAERGVAIVSAISHYPESTLDYLRDLSAQTPVLWSPNITIGINFLMLAGRVLQRIAPHLDVQIVEEHFRDKSDVSGTAKRIADELKVPASEIKSVRAGGIIGNHEVIFGFPFQTVRLRHESISREAFGNGAIFAAEQLCSLPSGWYRMEDLLMPYFLEDDPNPTALAAR
ncbi:MAG: hypothetical protein RL219_1007 [Actinomycetota bacterium]